MDAVLFFFFPQKPFSVLYTSEVSHLQAMLKFMNIFPLLRIAHQFFWGKGNRVLFTYIFNSQRQIFIHKI